MSVKLIIKDEVNIKFQNLPLDVRKKLANKFKYVVPHAKYHPAYRLGRWDGTVSYFTIGGTGYIYQLEEILKILSSNNIEIDEIEDNRKPIKFNFPRVTENYWADLNVVWPAGHQSEGQPIILRDYQIDAINTLIQNPQCLMSMATGSGKCRTYDSKMNIEVDETSDFGAFLKNFQQGE